jgi:very-short-patch-repair endonuclease
VLPHKNIKFAKMLRSNQTYEEQKLWQILRGSRLMNFKFRRQVPIDDFIVDFICFEQKLIIEIDGGQHFGSEKDVLRDAKLKALGFRVLRFWNNEITTNFDSVIAVILQQLQTKSPLPSPLVEQLSGQLSPQADKSPLIPQVERGNI